MPSEDTEFGILGFLMCKLSVADVTSNDLANPANMQKQKS